MLMSYIFRGKEVDIDITDQHWPYEWVFYNEPTLDQVEITDEEQEQISNTIDRFIDERSND